MGLGIFRNLPIWINLQKTSLGWETSINQESRNQLHKDKQLQWLTFLCIATTVQFSASVSLEGKNIVKIILPLNNSSQNMSKFTLKKSQRPYFITHENESLGRVPAYVVLSLFFQAPAEGGPSSRADMKTRFLRVLATT